MLLLLGAIQAIYRHTHKCMVCFRISNIREGDSGGRGAASLFHDEKRKTMDERERARRLKESFDLGFG